MKPKILIALAAAVTLAACGGQGPVADQAEDTSALPAPQTVNSTSPSGAPPPANAASRQVPSQATGKASVIPALFHGRWGLNPEDCIAGQRDNQGVLLIGPNELRFYESVATPVGNSRAAADSYSADFAFTGEGQSWTRFQTLRLQDGKLVRTESTPMASFTYARCQ